MTTVPPKLKLSSVTFSGGTARFRNQRFSWGLYIATEWSFSQ